MRMMQHKFRIEIKKKEGSISSVLKGIRFLPPARFLQPGRGSVKGELLLPGSRLGVQRNPAFMCEFVFGLHQKTSLGSKLASFNLRTNIGASVLSSILAMEHSRWVWRLDRLIAKKEIHAGTPFRQEHRSVPDSHPGRLQRLSHPSAPSSSSAPLSPHRRDHRGPLLAGRRYVDSHPCGPRSPR